MYQKLKQKGIHHVCLRVPDLQKRPYFTGMLLMQSL